MAVSLIILLGKEGKKLYFKETLEQPTGQSKMDNPETLKTLGTQKHTTKTKTKQNNNNNKTHNTTQKTNTMNNTDPTKIRRIE